MSSLSILITSLIWAISSLTATLGIIFFPNVVAGAKIWEYLFIHKIKIKLNDPTTEVYIVQNEFMLDVIRSELLKKSSGKKLPELFYLGGCTYKISFYFNPFGHYFV